MERQRWFFFVKSNSIEWGMNYRMINLMKKYLKNVMNEFSVRFAIIDKRRVDCTCLREQLFNWRIAIIVWIPQSNRHCYLYALRIIIYLLSFLEDDSRAIIFILWAIFSGIHLDAHFTGTGTLFHPYLRTSGIVISLICPFHSMSVHIIARKWGGYGKNYYAHDSW